VDVEPLLDAAERTLLSSDAAEAIDTFEATAPILAPAFGERAAKIGEPVRDYRFEDALAALREVTRR
jgi:hypothetical protein